MGQVVWLMKGVPVVPKPLLMVGGPPQLEPWVTAPRYQVPQTEGLATWKRGSARLRNPIPFCHTWAWTIPQSRGLRLLGWTPSLLEPPSPRGSCEGLGPTGSPPRAVSHREPWNSTRAATQDHRGGSTSLRSVTMTTHGGSAHVCARAMGRWNTRYLLTGQITTQCCLWEALSWGLGK